MHWKRNKTLWCLRWHVTGKTRKRQMAECPPEGSGPSQVWGRKAHITARRGICTRTTDSSLEGCHVAWFEIEKYPLELEVVTQGVDAIGQNCFQGVTGPVQHWGKSPNICLPLCLPPSPSPSFLLPLFPFLPLFFPFSSSLFFFPFPSFFPFPLPSLSFLSYAILSIFSPLKDDLPTYSGYSQTSDSPASVSPQLRL